MEKESSKNTYVLQEDENLGSVQIADEVVAMIASLAATEVDGVSAMGGNITNELMSKVGVKNLTKGVKVEVIGSSVKVELVVLLEYGYNIPATSQKVQERVKNAIENMTGLTVTDVNIRIAGVNMNAGKKLDWGRYGEGSLIALRSFPVNSPLFHYRRRTDEQKRTEGADF